jgi:hypothetical protein
VVVVGNVVVVLVIGVVVVVVVGGVDVDEVVVVLLVLVLVDVVGSVVVDVLVVDVVLLGIDVAADNMDTLEFWAPSLAYFFTKNMTRSLILQYFSKCCGVRIFYHRIYLRVRWFRAPCTPQFLGNRAWVFVVFASEELCFV